MPSKTPTDIIRDLEKSVATHDERIAFLLKGLENIQSTQDSEFKAIRERDLLTMKETGNFASELGVLQHRVGELERLQRNRVGYFWMLLGIVFGGVLSFIGNLIMTYFA